MSLDKCKRCPIEYKKEIVSDIFFIGYKLYINK